MLRLYFKTNEFGKTMPVKIMNDDNILSAYNDNTKKIDYGVLADSVGKLIMVYRDNERGEKYKIKSVYKDAKGNYHIRIRTYPWTYMEIEDEASFIFGDL